MILLTYLTGCIFAATLSVVWHKKEKLNVSLLSILVISIYSWLAVYSLFKI